MRRINLKRLIYLRDLLLELVARDMKLRYNRSVFGVAWSLLVPLAQLAIMYFVFAVILPLGIPRFTSFLFSGLLPWTWFQASLTAVTVAAPQNKDLLQQVGFPAGILPVIAVTTQLIHFTLALPILFVFLWWDGRPLNVALLNLPIVIGIQFAFTLSLAYFLAPIQALFHDTQHVLGLALTLLFYLLPVFYESSTVPDAYYFLYNCNPLVHLLDAYRSVLILGERPDIAPLLIVGVISATILVVGYRFYMGLHYRMLQEL